MVIFLLLFQFDFKLNCFLFVDVWQKVAKTNETDPWVPNSPNLISGTGILNFHWNIFLSLSEKNDIFGPRLKSLERRKGKEGKEKKERKRRKARSFEYSWKPFHPQTFCDTQCFFFFFFSFCS